MSRITRRMGILAQLDYPLLISLLTFFALNLVVVYSSTGMNTSMFASQVGNAIAGLTILIAITFIDPRWFARLSWLAYGVSVLLLLLVMFHGQSSKGAARWLNIGFRFQPSELLKLTVPVVLATYFGSKTLPAKWWQAGLALIIIGVPALLIFKQPDLGTALLVAASGLIIIFLAGVNKWIIFSAFGALTPLCAAAWFFFLKPYQKMRILVLLDPSIDTKGSAYNIIQSKIAIGSGGMWGKGWLHGTQAHLQFLPERHTDFAFAVFCEEFGYVGFLLLILMYLFVICRCSLIALKAQSSFERLLAGALTLMLFVYVFINMGMVSGILPVVGVPLPFVSYGGTAMITMSMAFGIIMSICVHRKTEQ